MTNATWEKPLIALAHEAWHTLTHPPQHESHRDQLLLQRAYDHCEAITAEHSRSFHLASSLLPTDKVVEEAAFDKYNYIRDAYLQHRRSEILDGEVPHEVPEDQSLR